MHGGHHGMCLSVKLILIYLIFSLSQLLFAAELPDMYTSARALGMGNAYMGLATEADALYYNPAGLARNGGVNLKLFGLSAGVGGVDSFSELKNLNGSSGSTFVSALNNLYGKHTWVGANGRAALTLPFFGLAVYNVADVGLVYNNPVYPRFDTNAVNDYGYTMGFGVPLGFIHWGLSLKYIKRSGTRDPISTSTLADLNFDTLKSKYTQWGRGYGMDTGFNFTLPAGPVRPVISLVWKNIGNTHFRSEDPYTTIPVEENEVAAGAAVIVSLPFISVTPAVDVRHINNSDLQITRKINFGLEIGLPLIDIRGGFREGYYTAGGGINLGFIRVDAATYGVELGAYPGQKEDRRYMVEVSMDLGIDLGFGDNVGSSSGKKGSGGSGSRGSFFGGRKLKQRR